MISLQERHNVKKKEEIWNNQCGYGKKSMFFAQDTFNIRGALIAFREIIMRQTKRDNMFKYSLKSVIFLKRWS